MLYCCSACYINNRNQYNTYLYIWSQSYIPKDKYAVYKYKIVSKILNYIVYNNLPLKILCDCICIYKVLPLESIIII